jgi:hypothetical protein
MRVWPRPHGIPTETDRELQRLRDQLEEKQKRDEIERLKRELRRDPYCEEHWGVYPTSGSCGPWCIARKHSTEYGYRYDKPLPEHSNFPTRKAAEAAKKELRAGGGA